MTHGVASFSTPDANTLNVTNTPGAIINWRSFSIGAAETTRFNQQGAASAVLNRVAGDDPSTLLGRLLSNGRVFVINRNGIVIGESAVVDTTGFVASTLNIADSDFLRGVYRFRSDAEPGDIANRGVIRAGANGDVFLIARNIENGGVIETRNGNIVLAAGKSITLTSMDLKNVSFEVGAPDGEVVNLGRVLARGGAVGMFAGTLRHEGIIEGNRLARDAQGEVWLVGERAVNVGGVVDVRGETRGGKVRILGDEVALSGAQIDASGPGGGGEVLVGGDYRGLGDLRTARNTRVDAASTIRADATDRGPGGRVIVWADDRTDMHGFISARGGPRGGDGGFVETSGKRVLDFSRPVDVGAPAGRPGTWLLDPQDIDIDSAKADSIASALNDGSNVSIETSDSGDGEGNISVSAAITKSEGDDAALSMRAHNRIDVNAPITSHSGELDLKLEAGAEVNVNSSIETNGGSFATRIIEISPPEAVPEESVTVSDTVESTDEPSVPSESGVEEDVPPSTDSDGLSSSAPDSEATPNADETRTSDSATPAGDNGSLASTESSSPSNGGTVTESGPSVETTPAPSSDPDEVTAAPDPSSETAYQIENVSDSVEQFAEATSRAATRDSSVSVSADIVTRGGDISVDAGENGTATVAAALDASNREVDGIGGDVLLLGDTIEMTSDASVDASGDAGGGKVTIGGDFRGGGDTPTATRTSVAEGATIRSDAVTAGDAGDVVIWADDTTSFEGAISARGGALSGDGGFVEISGRRELIWNGLTDLRAPNGEWGTLLLDPGTVNIDTTVGATGPDTWNNVYVGDQLDLGNLVIATSAAGTTNGTDENININAPVTWSAPTTFTLDAGADNNINDTLTATGGGSLDLNAGGANYINADLDFTGGTIVATTGDMIVDEAATVMLDNATIDSGGKLILNFAALETYNTSTVNTMVEGEGARVVVASGTLNLDGGFDVGFPNFDLNNGSLAINNGAGTLTVNDAWIFGDNTIDGNLVMTGNSTLHLCCSTPSTLTITGDLTLGSDTRLLFDTAGNTSNDFVSLDIGGTARFDGTLSLERSFNNAWEPANNDSWELITYDTRDTGYGSGGNGEFAVVDPPFATATFSTGYDDTANAGGFTLTLDSVKTIKTWVNPGSGNWEDGVNWSGGTVPGPDDAVLIDNSGNWPGTYEITLGTSTTVDEIFSNESLTLSGGTLTVDGTYMETGGVETFDSESEINADFTQQGNSEYASDGDLFIHGDFVWINGTQSGTGTTEVRGSNGTGIDFGAGGNDHVLSGGRTLYLDHQTAQLAGTETLTMNDATVSGWGDFYVDGTVVAASGTNVFLVGNWNGFDSGTYQVASGATLQFGNDYVNRTFGSGAQINLVDATSILHFAHGDFQFEDGASITGLGTVRIGPDSPDAFAFLQVDANGLDLDATNLEIVAGAGFEQSAGIWSDGLVDIDLAGALLVQGGGDVSAGYIETFNGADIEIAADTLRVEGGSGYGSHGFIRSDDQLTVDVTGNSLGMCDDTGAGTGILLCGGAGSAFAELISVGDQVINATTGALVIEGGAGDAVDGIVLPNEHPAEYPAAIGQIISFGTQDVTATSIILNGGSGDALVWNPPFDGSIGAMARIQSDGDQVITTTTGDLRMTAGSGTGSDAGTPNDDSDDFPGASARIRAFNGASQTLDIAGDLVLDANAPDCDPPSNCDDTYLSYARVRTLGGGDQQVTVGGDLVAIGADYGSINLAGLRSSGGQTIEADTIDLRAGDGEISVAQLRADGPGGQTIDATAATLASCDGEIGTGVSIRLCGGGGVEAIAVIENNDNTTVQDIEAAGMVNLKGGSGSADPVRELRGAPAIVWSAGDQVLGAGSLLIQGGAGSAAVVVPPGTEGDNTPHPNDVYLEGGRARVETDGSQDITVTGDLSLVGGRGTGDPARAGTPDDDMPGGAARIRSYAANAGVITQTIDVGGNLVLDANDPDCDSIDCSGTYLGYTEIRSYNGAEQVVEVDGNLTLVGADYGDTNFSQIRSAGDQTVTVGGATGIDLDGGDGLLAFAGIHARDDSGANQVVRARNVDIDGGGGDGSFARVMSEGGQTVEACSDPVAGCTDFSSGDIDVTGGSGTDATAGFGAFAEISQRESTLTQTVQANSLTVTGGSGEGALASINAAGNQFVTTHGNSVTLTGGSAPRTFAEIFSEGDQVLDITGALSAAGGSGSAAAGVPGAYAGIFALGAQDVAADTIALAGGSGVRAYAEIWSDGGQTVLARDAGPTSLESCDGEIADGVSIRLCGGSEAGAFAGINSGSATPGDGGQTVMAAGIIDMLGGSGSASPATENGFADLSGGSATMHSNDTQTVIAGDMILRGGSGDSTVIVGATINDDVYLEGGRARITSQGDQSVTVAAGECIDPDDPTCAGIGPLQTTGGGNLTMIAGSGSGEAARPGIDEDDMPGAVARIRANGGASQVVNVAGDLVIDANAPACSGGGCEDVYLSYGEIRTEENGDQAVNVGGDLTLVGADYGDSNLARIRSGGNQTVIVEGPGGIDLDAGGGLFALASISVRDSATAAQTVRAQVIDIAGGDGDGAAGRILSRSTGTQEVSVCANPGGACDTFNPANALTLTAGTGSTAPSSLGPFGAGAFVRQRFFDAGAPVAGAGDQQVNAGAIVIDAGDPGGEGSSAGIATDGRQTVTTSGDVTLTGGAAVDADAVLLAAANSTFAPATHMQTVTVGGNLLVTAGAGAGADAVVGQVGGAGYTSSVTIGGSSVTVAQDGADEGGALLETTDLVADDIVIAGGTVDVDGTLTGNAVTDPDLMVTAGQFNYNGAANEDLAVLDQDGGTVGGTGTLTVNDFQWGGGTQTGVGTTVATNGVTFDGPGTRGLVDRTLTLGASTTLPAGATLAMTDATIDGAGPLNVDGTLTSDGTSTIDTELNNDSNETVQTNAGTLSLAGGGSSTGTFDTAGGATLSFSGNTFLLDDGTSFTGGGVASVDGGTVQVGDAPADTITVQNGANLNHGAGTLDGTGTLVVSAGGSFQGAGPYPFSIDDQNPPPPSPTPDPPPVTEPAAGETDGGTATPPPTTEEPMMETTPSQTMPPVTGETTAQSTNTTANADSTTALANLAQTTSESTDTNTGSSTAGGGGDGSSSGAGGDDGSASGDDGDGASGGSEEGEEGEEGEDDEGGSDEDEDEPDDDGGAEDDGEPGEESSDDEEQGDPLLCM